MPPFSNPPIVHGDPVEDDVPAFDASSSEWVPRPRGAGGGGTVPGWKSLDPPGWATPNYPSLAALDGLVYVLADYTTQAFGSWDPATRTWTRLADTLAGQNGYMHSIFAVGTAIVKADAVSVEVYDPGTDEWTAADPMPVPSDTAMLVPDTLGKLRCYYTDAGTNMVTALDPVTGVWAAPAPPIYDPPSPFDDAAWPAAIGLDVIDTKIVGVTNAGDVFAGNAAAGYDSTQAVVNNVGPFPEGGKLVVVPGDRSFLLFGLLKIPALIGNVAASFNVHADVAQWIPPQFAGAAMPVGLPLDAQSGFVAATIVGDLDAATLVVGGFTSLWELADEIPLTATSIAALAAGAVALRPASFGASVIAPRRARRARLDVFTDAAGTQVIAHNGLTTVTTMDFVRFDGDDLLAWNPGTSRLTVGAFDLDASVVIMGETVGTKASGYISVMLVADDNTESLPGSPQYPLTVDNNNGGVWFTSGPGSYLLPAGSVWKVIAVIPGAPAGDVDCDFIEMFIEARIA